MSEWIKCSERMPETEDNVLVCTKKIPGICSSLRLLGWFCKERELWIIPLTDEQEMSIPVTYWQPLPEPTEAE